MRNLEKIIQDIEDEELGNVLHVLNGQCLYEELKAHHALIKNHSYCCWNEAMCWGSAKREIFSTSFIENRIHFLHTTKQDYQKIVLDSLMPLKKEKFDTIICWFGKDMFCQINLLTLCAYLEQIQYCGKLLGCIFDETNNRLPIDFVEIKNRNYLECYHQVVCEKRNRTEDVELKVMKDAIFLYLNYESEESEIHQYIKKHRHENDNLIQQLMKKFPQYGLGDQQYREMIKKMNKKNNQ